MFANTIPVFWGTSGGLTVTRINQDAYSSEYRLRSSNGDVTSLNIRHSKYSDKSRAGISVDRHNVEMTYVHPGDDASVQPYKAKAYLVFETDSNSSNPDFKNVVRGVAEFLSSDETIARLAAWES